MMATNSESRAIQWIMLVVVLACLAHSACLENGFVYDDEVTVKDNPGLGSLLSYKAYLSRDYFRLSRESTYRPLVTATYALDYAVWGARPFGYHLTNLLWHCLACAAFFAVCRSLGAPHATSAAAAALYASHPALSEAVCSIGYREDLMCAAFYFAAFALWPGSREQGRARRMRLAASLALFVLASLSKEMALSFPLLVMAKEWRAAMRAKNEARRPERGRPWLFTLRYALISLIAVAAFLLAVTYTPPKSPIEVPVNPLPQRIVAFTWIAARYVGLLMAPYPLLADYSITMRGAFFWSAGAASLAFLLGAGMFAFTRRRAFPAGFESLAAFLLMLGPVSNVVPLFHPMALRYLALPAAAFCWLAANALSAIHRRKAALSAVAGVVCVYVTLSWLRASEWRSNETLWGADVRRAPSSAMANANLGYALARTGNVKEALRYLSEAIRLQPDNAVAHNNLGSVLEGQGKIDEAIREYEEAVRFRPGSAIAHYNAACLLEKRGRIDEAIRHYTETARLQPDHILARYNAGCLLSDGGKVDEAIGQFQEALRYAPDFVDARNNLGLALAQCGRREEAIAQFLAALKQAPDHAGARVNLAISLVRLGRNQEALQHCGQVERANPNDARVRLGLGNLLERLGQPERAIRQYRAALSLAQAAADRGLASEIQKAMAAMAAPAPVAPSTPASR